MAWRLLWWTAMPPKRFPAHLIAFIEDLYASEIAAETTTP